MVSASLLEPFFIRQLDLGAILKIGLIEEFAKILGVLVIARHRRHDSEMDGLILGAAAGMGFLRPWKATVMPLPPSWRTMEVFRQQ